MTQMTLPQAFEMATRQQQSGNLAAAEAIYRQILGSIPDQPDALHMLGVLAMQAGKLEIAMQLIDRSIQINPAQPGYLVNRAQLLTNLGRLDDAIVAYRQALGMKPGLLEANFNLANLLRQRGDLPAAAEHYRAAAEAMPASPDLWTYLAVAWGELGNAPAAAETWRRVLTLQPENPDAHNNLGNALQEMGEYGPAIEAYQRALSLREAYPEAYNNLGNAYLRSDRPQQAAESFQRAVEQKPDYAEAYRGLGNALKHRDQFDAAIEAHQRSIALQPTAPQAISDLGSTLHAAGTYEEAAAKFQQSIDVSPDFPEGHFNLGLSLLLRGQFERGWEEHEWRWNVASHRGSRIRFSMPRWNGEPIDGKRLLLYAEQGFGDTIMAIRYLPLVKRRGATITLICQQELARLVGTIGGIDRLIIPTEADLPPIDAELECSLMSLPRIFQTRLESIPTNVPYLRADPALVERYQPRIASAGDRLKVGLVWSGRQTPDPKRSIQLDELAPLAQVTGAAFFSLQHGEAGVQVRTSPPPELHLLDITQGITDFAATAALIESLDLLITIDTAAAHLAGAMGKPVWVLLPFVPDWRWMLDRSDSPWYPTMKLFRQSQIGDWSGPVRAVAHALSGMSR